MRLALSLLAAAALVLGTTASSTAYQPPVVIPGGVWACTLRVVNEGDTTVTATARVRAQADGFWNSPSDASRRGRWVAVDAPDLAPGEIREVVVHIPVPDPAPRVMRVEIEADRRSKWRPEDPRTLALVEGGTSSPGAPGRSVPFCVVAGGTALYERFGDGESNFQWIEESVEDGTAWDALRARLGIVSPDSWGLLPNEGDAPHDFRHASFASLVPPDLSSEMLVLRTPAYTHAARPPDARVHPFTRPRRFWVRGVEERSDGTVVCRFSYRTRRWRPGGRPYYDSLDEGRYLIVAIPRTDAAIEFRRVR